MTTETQASPQTETTRKLFPKSSKWVAPPTWEEWDFLIYCACPNLKEWLAKAPDVKRPCPDCGKVETWDAIHAAIMPNAKCEECIDAYEAGKRGNGEVSLVEQNIEQTIPLLFQDTDRERLIAETTRAQVERAMAWEVTEKGQGLVLVGDTGTGKTRTMCLLLNRLIRYRVKVKAFFHGSFYDELLEVIRSEKNLRRWKAEIIEYPVIAIDDLFSEKLTERGEATLFEIIDARICNQRPTIITTQVTKREGSLRFHSVKRAEAFFRRLNEFFDAIPTKRTKQEEITIG